MDGGPRFCVRACCTAPIPIAEEVWPFPVEVPATPSVEAEVPPVAALPPDPAVALWAKAGALAIEPHRAVRKIRF